ncbi:hypothetical protein [Demequina capsici]|uniref:Uncharacterized protein n=1 Tax=Demequina capsici TaxID=3075620 RepID=A0AA96F872_9MICO|nr:hypothetical protein [Demequina sp. OYTSA14]WNM24430.1 hypothetical protein RN606_13860 [Demequina sp. OYTSA14]
MPDTTRYGTAGAGRGETYGVDADDAHPDLIAAYATNGKVGYIRRTELEAVQGPLPTSPAEAAARMQDPTPGTGSIPVYESDGVTVIGEFTITGG